jgi:hypothetical protein
LPRDVAPPRDLWPAIQAQLEPVARPGRRLSGWHAAAAAVLVVASSAVTAVFMRSAPVASVAQAPTPSVQAPGGTSPSSNVTMAPGALRAAFGPTHALDAEYVAARKQLSTMLDERIDRLPPSAREKVVANLAEMRRAADEINRALATAPGDPLLEELLLTTYQEELAVLASVNQLAGSVAGPDKGIDL